MADRITMDRVYFYIDRYNSCVEELFNLYGVDMPKIGVHSAYGYKVLTTKDGSTDIRCGLSTREAYEMVYGMWRVADMTRSNMERTARNAAMQYEVYGY